MTTIVLLPGMDGTGRLFEPLIAALGPAFSVLVVRYPEHEVLDYDSLAAIARRSLPADGDFILLGESFSGPIAVKLAASKPPGLVGLVLCCTFVRNPRPALAPARGLLRYAPVGLLPGAVLSALLLGRFATASLRAAVKSAVAMVADAVLKERLNDVISVDMTAELSGLNIAVLYLQASHDSLVPAEAGRHIMEVYPRTQLLRLAGPHCLLQAAAADSAKAIQDFCVSLAGIGQ